MVRACLLSFGLLTPRTRGRAGGWVDDVLSDRESKQTATEVVFWFEMLELLALGELRDFYSVPRHRGAAAKG